MTVLLQGREHNDGIVGLQGGQNHLVPPDAITGLVLTGLFAHVHRHRQLKFEQYRLERDIELPVACQLNHRSMEQSVCVVAMQIICGSAHLVQCGADRRKGGARVHERQRSFDGVPFKHMAKREELQDVRGRPFRNA